MEVVDMSPREAIDTVDHPFFNLLRFLLSDQVRKSVDCVCEGNVDPISYTRFIVKNNWKSIISHFEHQYTEGKDRLSVDIQKAWVYDMVLDAAVYMRIAKLRPRHISSVGAIFESSFPIKLISKESDDISLSYGGLLYFRDSVELYLKQFEMVRKLTEIGMINRLCKAIGSVDDATWIFHDPIWNKTFSSSPNRLHILRRFLYKVLVAHISSDEFVTNGLNTTREELDRFTVQFLDLCEDKSTTSEDIRVFLSDIEFLNFDTDKNTFLTSLYEEPYRYFEKIHRNAYGDVYSNDMSIKTKCYDDVPEWCELRNISPEFSPEKVVEENILIHDYIDGILEKHALETFSGPINTICKDKGLSLPRTITKEWNWLKSFMIDQLYCSLVAKRFYNLNHESPDEARDTASFQSHILLIIEDKETERYGLSLIDETLGKHVQVNYPQFTSQEQDSLDSLVWGWGKLNINKPNKMNKAWKHVLKEKSIRQHLRTLMFTIIEAMNIPWEENAVDKYLTYSRAEFFKYLDVFTEYLSGTPSVEEITEFLSDMPMMKQHICHTKWDSYVWTLPFSMIPKPEEDSQDSEHHHG